MFSEIKKKRGSGSKISVCKQLEDSDDIIAQHADEFKDLIVHFKSSTTRKSIEDQAKKIKCAFQYFLIHVPAHLNIEESVLFPFLKKHIPRLEYTLYLLESEHQDFRNGMTLIQKYLTVFLKSTPLKRLKLGLVDKICATGSYFIYLLRHHAEVESKSLHDAIQHELKKEEREMLEIKLQRYLNPDYALENGSRHNILAHLEFCKCSGRPQWYALRFA